MNLGHFESGWGVYLSHPTAHLWGKPYDSEVGRISVFSKCGQHVHSHARMAPVDRPKCPLCQIKLKPQ